MTIDEYLEIALQDEKLKKEYELLQVKEAIELVEQCGLNISGIKHDECEKVVLSVLEKQIPKKPVKKNPICYNKTKDGKEYYTYDYHCPVCDKKLKLQEHHCPCGQALDWSDTE